MKREDRGTVRQPSAGWFTTGTHVAVDVPLRFSEETDEAGLPLWERPLTPSERFDPTGNTEAAAWTDHHLREAVAVVRGQYGPGMEFEAQRWLIMAFLDALGYQESAGYPVID